MKRTIIILLSVLLVLLLAVTGTIAYMYTSNGNSHIRSYVEKRVREQTGLPVVFDKFQLRRGHLYFIAVMGQEASLGFDGAFNILKQSISGRYLFRALKLKYQTYTLRQANLSGHVHGTIDDISIDGKGTLLDGPVAYRLKIHDKDLEDMVIQLRKLPIEELLLLSGNQDIIKGELNADILMPSLGKKGSKGKALVQLDKAKFDPILIRKLYNYTLPMDKTSLEGELDVELDGEKGIFEGKILSDLLNASISNGQLNISEKTAAGDFAVDAKEMAPMTKSKLNGPLKLSGVIKYDALGARIKARTDSLGGNIDIDYTKGISAVLKDVSLSRLLHMTTLPDYADGKINGKLKLDGPKAQKGSYALKLSDGRLHVRTINAKLGISLPAGATLSLDSTGKFIDGILSAKSELRSSLFSIKTTKSVFDINSEKFNTDYLLNIPNPMLLVGKKSKGTPVTLSGTATKEKELHIKGSAKGLGDRLVFDYSGDYLKIDGDNVDTGMLLASVGQPVMVSGVMDARVDFSRLKPLTGYISIAAPRLKTDPKMMEKIAGRSIDTTLSLSLQGSVKKGILYAKSDIKSPMMNISFPKLVYNIKTSTFSSPYHLNIPDLIKAKPLTDTELKGSFVSDGNVKKAKYLSLDGSSTSFGGKLTYKLSGSRLDARIISAPLPKLLHLIDQPNQMLGSVNGDIKYNTRTKTGNTHITVDGFQFKSGKLTTAVKVLLQKDLSQIIYDRTVVDGTFKDDKISYRANAQGKRSDFDIKDGVIDTGSDTNKAHFYLRIDQTDVTGTVSGPTKDPQIALLPGKMVQEKIKQKALEKVKDVVDKNSDGALKQIIKKIPLFDTHNTPKGKE